MKNKYSKHLNIKTPDSQREVTTPGYQAEVSSQLQKWTVCWLCFTATCFVLPQQPPCISQERHSTCSHQQGLPGHQQMDRAPRAGQERGLWSRQTDQEDTARTHSWELCRSPRCRAPNNPQQPAGGSLGCRQVVQGETARTW